MGGEAESVAGSVTIKDYTRVELVIGETLQLEVEEVGIKVRNLRYYKSQPWGRSSSLLMGFFCDVDAKTGKQCDRALSYDGYFPMVWGFAQESYFTAYDKLINQ